MNRVIKLLIGVVAVAALLQWFVPRWVGGFLARQISRADHGPKPKVAINALPFWELIEGRFQAVTVQASQADFQSLTIQRAHLSWTNGQLAMGALEKGQIKVDQPGHLTMTMWITAAALSQFIAAQGTVSDPSVTITPSGVAMTGKIKLDGSEVPLDTKGSLVASANRRALVFHPKSIDGLNLPVLTNVQLINLSKLPLPMPLTIQKVDLEHNQVGVTIGN